MGKVSKKKLTQADDAALHTLELAGSARSKVHQESPDSAALVANVSDTISDTAIDDSSLAKTGVLSSVKVEYRRVDKDVSGPLQATPGSAGFDLFSRQQVMIPSGAIAVVPLNVVVKIPPGFVGLLAIRSGLARNGIVLANGMGVIDSDYHGPSDEIAALLYNTNPHAYVVGRGQRVAQLLMVPLFQAHGTVEFVEVDGNLRDDNRGGFGSTGY